DQIVLVEGGGQERGEGEEEGEGEGGGGWSAGGEVTCLEASDLPWLHEAMAQPPTRVAKACLVPRLEDLALYYSAHTAAALDELDCSGEVEQEEEEEEEEGQRLPGLDQVLQQYVRTARLTPHYFCGDMAPMVAIAGLLSPSLGLHLNPTELLTFCCAPADVNVAPVAEAMLRFAALYLEEGLVPLAAALPAYPSFIHTPHTARPPCLTFHQQAELKALEEQHAVLDLYVWLAYRLPLQFSAPSNTANEPNLALAKLVPLGPVSHERAREEAQEPTYQWL
ncbi:hypothetical protein QJQ45_016157, partial [Haematococcus lacustris]